MAQNMAQSNIALLPAWRAIPGNENSDLPVGWNGPGGSADRPTVGPNAVAAPVVQPSQPAVAQPVVTQPQQSPNLGVNNGQPTFDLVAATKAAYETPEIQAAQKAITDRQAALATAQTGINDDPFYSESRRVGEQRKLQDQANRDIGVQQNLLNSLKTDAQIKLNAQQGQYDINEQAYKTSLDNFNNIVSQGGLDNASDSDIANWAIQTGIPTSMIKSIQQQSVKKNNSSEKASIQPFTDNQGNITILAIDPTTGKIINQTIIPGAGKESKPVISGGGKPLSAADQKVADTQQNMKNVTAAAKAGAQLKELVDHYKSVLSIDDIYRIYNSNAKTPAKESLASIKTGRYANIANSGWQPAIKPK